MSCKNEIKDVVCCGCSLLCDDIHITIHGSHISNVRNACIIGEQRFRVPESKSRISTPIVKDRKGGEARKVQLNEAIERAAKLLDESKKPLLYGWGSTTCEAQRIGLRLAKMLEGVVAGPFYSYDREFLKTIEKEGYFSCTFGHIKNRASLLIFLYCNPLDSHPRLLSRYTVFPAGFFNQGRPDRKIVVIDYKETEISNIADKFFKIKPHVGSFFLSTLELALEKQEPIVSGQLKSEDFKYLIEQIKDSSFGVLFFEVKPDLDPERILSLCKKLNETRNFVFVELKRPFNVKGFMMTMLCETGHFLGADFSHKCPSSELIATEILERQECDSALVIGADPMSNLPWKAARHLSKIPLIVIDPYWSPTVEIADVVIPSALSGVEADGTAYRLDGVPFRLKRVIDPPEGCLPDEEILRLLSEMI
jgi:formylmethanofuran dehydrogenase subunit B